MEIFKMFRVTKQNKLFMINFLKLRFFKIYFALIILKVLFLFLLIITLTALIYCFANINYFNIITYFYILN